MKKTLSVLLIMFLLFVPALPAFAADGEPEFRFALSVNGKNVAEVETGDLITVSLNLERLNGNEPFTMYGMQDELRYDGSFLELVDGSLLTAPDIETADISVHGAIRELYINYVSLTGGEQWESNTYVGNVQFRVIGTEGISRVTNMDAEVSGPDGQSSLPCLWQDVSIVIAGDCLIHFESNGGTEYTDRIVRCGQLLTPPEDPKRPGYSFTGWFRNAELTEIWDFENEIIGEDLTLYAGWTKDENSAISAEATQNGPGWLWLIMLMPLLTLLLLLLIRHKVHFDTAGAEEIRDRFVFGSSLVEMPAVPNLPGHVFMGWYRDKELTMQWDFEKDKVTESMTLYAKWN